MCAYRAPEGAEEGGMPRCGPLPVLRADSALRDARVGDRHRNLEA